MNRQKIHEEYKDYLLRIEQTAKDTIKKFGCDKTFRGHWTYKLECGCIMYYYPGDLRVESQEIMFGPRLTIMQQIMIMPWLFKEKANSMMRKIFKGDN